MKHIPGFSPCFGFAIWGALRDLVPFVQFKKRENTHGGVLILEACNFAKINTLPWVFFMFFKLCKWYQIAQRTIFVAEYKSFSQS